MNLFSDTDVESFNKFFANAIVMKHGVTSTGEQCIAFNCMDPLSNMHLADFIEDMVPYKSMEHFIQYKKASKNLLLFNYSFK